MDKYLFSYATESDPPLKRGIIRLVEKATGQPKLKRMYIDNQRYPRANETFFQAAVRSLALDVRYDADSLAAIPKTGPVVVVANHPYGVLDGIVISWLVGKVRPDFVVLTNAILMRAPGDQRLHPADRLQRDRRSEADQPRHARRGARSARQGRRGRGVSGRGCFDRSRQARPQARRRRALAAVRVPAHPAVEGDGRSDLVRRAEQPAFPDRQPCELHVAHFADLS